MTTEEKLQMLSAALSNELEAEIARLHAENFRLREHNNMLAMEVQAYVEHIDELLAAVRAAGGINMVLKPRRPRQSSRSSGGPPRSSP
jgi:predicted nuclease with TOPRIM domain